MEIRNQGLDLERELLEQSGEDYILGAKTPRGIADDIDYKSYLPAGERQNLGEEKMDCASRSPINILETKFNYLLIQGKISQEDFAWLNDNNYLVEMGDNACQIEFSDAFVAIMSGTTRSGNSLKAPCQAIHEFGLIPKRMLPQIPSFNDYHNPDRITKEMKDLGLEFLERFSIRYYKDYDYTDSNEMLNTAGYAWGNIVNGVYQRTMNSYNHAFAYLTKTSEAFDNYIDSVDGDFIKKLALDYRLLPYSYKLVINKKVKTRLSLREIIKRYLCVKYKDK